jgi:hypothetical protein
MQLLWIATKAPVPATDGGRLAMLLTLAALSRAGVETTMVAPVGSDSDRRAAEIALDGICRPRLVQADPRRPAVSAIRALLGGSPYSIQRHSLGAVRAEVGRLVDADRFDCVHCEQVQAFGQAEPVFRAGLPVVLRAQNVESDLWSAVARLHPWLGPGLALEARRLARYEGEAVRRAAATVALAERDALRLRELGGGRGEVIVIPPPFPSELPAGDIALSGEPPVVLLASAGWLPNRDADRWFLETIWPEVRARMPEAVLHRFAPRTDLGSSVEGARTHPPPGESREAFPPGAVLVVPLRIASGVRMKILEAWARGVPVVATPEAAAGLETAHLREILIAKDGPGFAGAIGRLSQERGLAGRLIAAGRRALAARHEPGAIAEALRKVYLRAASRGASRGLENDQGVR